MTITPTTRTERRDEQERQRARKLIAQMSDQACTILLVRHGETDWNVSHRLQGQLLPGPGLNQRGFHQAISLAQALAQRHPPVSVMYSSDLLRAQQTAAEIVQAVKAAHPEVKVDLHLDPGLRERNMGVIQGMVIDEARERHPEAFGALSTRDRNLKIPGGGESVEDLTRRIASTLQNIATSHPASTVIVVAHGGVLHAAFHRAVGRNYGGAMSNCSINTLKLDPVGLDPGPPIGVQGGNADHTEKHTSSGVINEDGGGELLLRKECVWAVVDWGVTSHLDVLDAWGDGFGGGQGGG